MRRRRMHRPSMRDALSSSGRAMVADLLRSNPLLAFDFDGTLAPLVADPAAAVLPPQTAEPLWRLALRVPCVVISGRARADVLARLKNIPIAEVVGNHGSEPWVDSEPLRAQVARWLPILTKQLGPIPGILLEDKGCSLSIHYRHVLDPDKILTTIREVIETLGVGRILHGKYVLNLLPAGALDKGAGLRRAMAALGRTRALYVGDDETDEDVFRLPAEAGVLGIRVGKQGSSSAPLYLWDQPEVDTLLRYLETELA
jgi:trehalose 6-phosphate phosphatase